MAGSNLSQVFIANADLKDHADTTPASLAAGNVGMYVLDSAYASFVNDAAWNTFDRINFMQGINGSNPIASPIIDTRNIRRIDYTKHVATVAHKVVIGGTPVSGQTLEVRIVVRAIPTDYVNFFPDGFDYSLDASGYNFPLASFNTTNHKVFPLEILTGSTTLATETAKIQAAIQANPVLNAMFKTSVANTIEARHAGLIFDVIINDAAGAATGLTTTVTGFVPGVGNAWQVIGDVKRTQFKQGSMNRMYFADNHETNVNATWKYDKIVIEYAHDWPSSTGIAPAGELNQLVIYLGDSATALAAGDFAGFQTVFEIALATDEDQLQEAL
jgi:hypothetical protein